MGHADVTQSSMGAIPISRSADDAIVANSLEDALSIASDDPQPFIIGGGEIYKIALDYCDRIELTIVHDNFEGDTVFPEIDDEKWRESNRIEKKKDENHNYDFTFITYNKIKSFSSQVS